MRRLSILAVFVLMLGTFFVSSADAQVRRYYRGQITRGEAQRIRRSNRRVIRTERRAYRDGYVTNRERNRIYRAINRRNRVIYRSRTNNRYRRY